MDRQPGESTVRAARLLDVDADEDGSLYLRHRSASCCRNRRMLMIITGTIARKRITAIAAERPCWLLLNNCWNITFATTFVSKLPLVIVYTTSNVLSA